MKPRFIVCEDGDEYRTRFLRFLGGEFELTPARDLASAEAAASGATGLLLDLDFRRTEPALLVDEAGCARPQLPEGERERLSEVQGILILRALRARGIHLPALLFADLDDARQVEDLTRALGPLQVVPGSEGIRGIAQRMRGICRV